MLAELLKALLDLGDKNATPKEVPSGDPYQKSFVIDGVIVSFPTKPKPRDHKVDSLDDLITLANRFAALMPVVWIHHDSVKLVIDDKSQRIESVTMKLTTSSVYDTILRLDAMHSNAWFSPKDFARLLRIDLYETLGSSILLDIVKNVKFETGTTNGTEIAKGRESISKEFKGSVKSTADIPEEVKLSVPVYSGFGMDSTYDLPCSIEVDYSLNKFRLLPLPDQLDKITRQALDLIKGNLDAGLDKKIPSYFGTA